MVFSILLYLTFTLLFSKSQSHGFSSALSKDDKKGWEAEARELEKSLNLATGGLATGSTSDENDEDFEKGSCSIALPQKAKASCSQTRREQLHQRRNLYRFTDPRSTKQDYPVSNISTKDIINATMSDPNLKKWFGLFSKLHLNTKTLLYKWLLKNPEEIGSFERIIEIYEFFINGAPQGDAFKYPWIGDENFSNVVYNGKWKDDGFFTDQRFAGSNPMAIQKLTFDGKYGLAFSDLEEKLSLFFDWSDAVSDAIGKRISFTEAIKRGLIYVLRYPLLDNAITMPDIGNDIKQRHMMNTSSPIAVFVVSRNKPSYTKRGRVMDDTLGDDFVDEDDSIRKNPYKMHPVAIQIDNKPDSCVFTPADEDEWMLAKARIQMADIYDALLYQHILKVHIVMETICLSIYRHFPEDHPLFQILKFHCGPVVTLGIISIRNVIKDNGIIHTITSLGSDGASNMLNDGYKLINWKELAFSYDIKKRGMSDRKISYYPYRDDGRIVMATIKHFTRNYIKMYYDQRDVRADSELQNFANELSADGVGPEGSLGKLKGFPSVIKTRRQLVSVMSQIIWIASGQHSAMNFPSSLYASFAPNTPSKLYYDKRHADDVFSVFRFPGERVVLNEIALGMNVGTMRYDSFLDYGPLLRHKRARNLVNAYKSWSYDYLTKKIKSRNKKRHEDGHLSYPFLLPNLITNSVGS